MTPKPIAVGMPFESLFVPINTLFFDWIGTSSLSRRQYGEMAPLPELKHVSFPSDYAERNFLLTVSLFLITFTLLICIAWYYFVTVIHDYEAKCLIYTAFFVRIPLAMVGVYFGSILYSSSQVFLCLALVSFNSGGNRKISTASISVCVAFGLTLAHVILWFLSVMPRMTLLTFQPYMREKYLATNLFQVGNMDASSPMMPLLVILLALEPITTLFMQVLLFAKWQSAFFLRFFS